MTPGSGRSTSAWDSEPRSARRSTTMVRKVWPGRLNRGRRRCLRRVNVHNYAGITAKMCAARHCWCQNGESLRGREVDWREKFKRSTIVCFIRWKFSVKASKIGLKRFLLINIRYIELLGAAVLVPRVINTSLGLWINNKWAILILNVRCLWW